MKNHYSITRLNAERRWPGGGRRPSNLAGFWGCLPHLNSVNHRNMTLVPASFCSGSFSMLTPTAANWRQHGQRPLQCLGRCATMPLSCLLVAGMVLTAQAAVPMAPDEAQRESFKVVAEQLHLGGDSYSYINLDGVIRNFAEANNTLIPDAVLMSGSVPPGVPYMMLKLVPLLEPLGVFDWVGYGQSSYQVSPQAFRNRFFLATRGEPTGLLEILGGPPEAFGALDLIPATADLAIAQMTDLAGLVTLARALVSGVIGEGMLPMIDGALAQPVEAASGLDFSWAELLDGPPIRSSAAFITGNLAGELAGVDLRDGDDFGQTVMAAIDVMVFLEVDSRRLALLRAIFERDFRLEEVKFSPVGGGWERLDLPSNPETPFKASILLHEARGVAAFGLQGDALEAHLKSPKPLKADTTFRAAVADLPAAGSGLTYLSPRLLETIQVLKRRVIAAEPRSAFAFTLYESFLPILGAESVGRGYASVTTSLANGLLVDQLWPSPSLGGELAGTGVYVMGLTAAMAIPAFQKVRQESRSSAILRQLRIVASASQQYMLETGASEVTYSQLVGEYIEPLASVAGESYEGLVVREDSTQLSVTTASGEVITYHW